MSAEIPAGLALVSWGRANGGGLSAQVVSTSAHLVVVDDDWRTLCGVEVPRVARPSTPTGQRYGGGALRSVYPDDARETAAQPRCGRCAKSKRART